MSVYDSRNTSWVAYTPTGSWSANTSYSGSWRRIGDSAQYHIRISLSGAPTSATLTVNLASGHTIDTTKTSSTAAASFAKSSVEILAAGSGYFGQVGYNSTTSIQILTMQGATSNNNITLVTQAAPNTFANSDFIDINFTVPIVGW